MLFIVPSRGRPENVEALIGAWDQTRVFARLFVAVDADDPRIRDYAKILQYAPDWVTWRRTQPGLGMVGVLNRYANEFSHYPLKQTDVEDIIGFMGDDHRPRTYGWDALMQGASNLDNGGAMVYGNDLLQSANLPTQVTLPSVWIRAMGHMAPPELQHLYVDNYWKTLGALLGRLVYLPDCVIEHMHPVAGKAPWDDGYRRVNGGDVYAADHKAFCDLLERGRIDRDAQLIGRTL